MYYVLVCLLNDDAVICFFVLLCILPAAWYV